MSPRVPVSDAELEVLKVLWTAGPATVRDMAAALTRQRRHLAYNTVLTLLSRLREKGYVAAGVRQGSDQTHDTVAGAKNAHVFRAIVSRDELLGSTLTALADRLCDGTASPLVHALVRGRRFSADEIAHFRKLIDDLSPKD